MGEPNVNGRFLAGLSSRSQKNGWLLFTRIKNLLDNAGLKRTVDTIPLPRGLALLCFSRLATKI
jgi:hypothetical protein